MAGAWLCIAAISSRTAASLKYNATRAKAGVYISLNRNVNILKAKRAQRDLPSQDMLNQEEQ